ncbi:MAG TPA: small acid-soluble spore protein Tlp [Bacillus sp. (in: firmicutes)]|uniref:small acid-soluble spore protein Tlp n=1 Tax=Bacillus litorisediminis TaxID=2922713 RepID=UPI001FACCD4C|nr:small acid-soluble spore protein Tlp [Bacillus litorisediminis]HWO75302.1 small acid-soluble spore protein Tlp [Bacillus sp. (in: firmicutes)]
MDYQKPKPDDRSDNVEKLQSMVQNTIENIEEAEASLEFSSGEQRKQIEEKNERRRESIAAFREEIKDESKARK